MEKPTRKEDLIPSYTVIGEGNWEDEIRKLLVAYGLPLPEPVSEQDLVMRENQLGFRLPGSFHLFLACFGPVNFDGLRLYRLQEIRPANFLWFKEQLNEHDAARLSRMLAIAEDCIRDPIVLEPDSGRCCLLSHDPAGFSNWMNSFDDLIKISLIDLSWSYWGWPDHEIVEMAKQVKQDLFRTIRGAC